MCVLAGALALKPRPAPSVRVTAAPAHSAVANPYGPLVGLGPRPHAQAAADVQTGDAGGALVASVEPAPPAEPATAPEFASPADALDAAPAAPLPPRRPAGLGQLASRSAPQVPARQIARVDAAAPVAPAPPAENRSFFERLFGAAEAPAPQPQAARRAPSQALAYAATPDTGGGLFGGLKGAAVAPSPAPRADRYTAIYDISSHTVYMPNGQRLEAHSGLGARLDDPRYVHERMRGATPPHVYDLSPREALFHGVEAIRLTPVGGGGAIYGRAGLLAHTYMLGPNGDSNGCVSFRDYNAFLQAYKNGEVKRLVVVAHL